jgi:hypothetical protein
MGMKERKLRLRRASWYAALTNYTSGNTSLGLALDTIGKGPLHPLACRQSVKSSPMAIQGVMTEASHSKGAKVPFWRILWVGSMLLMVTAANVSDREGLRPILTTYF